MGWRLESGKVTGDCRAGTAGGTGKKELLLVWADVGRKGNFKAKLVRKA